MASTRTAATKHEGLLTKQRRDSYGALFTQLLHRRVHLHVALGGQTGEKDKASAASICLRMQGPRALTRCGCADRSDGPLGG